MNETNIPNPISPDELWLLTAKALDNGDFTWLGELLTAQDASIISLLEANGEPKEYMDEAFTWACFEGRTSDAKTLLDKGVDPAAGIKTGLAGFHWAANRGNLDTVKMLIERGAPLEQVNMYGGTVLGQTLWSAINEHKDIHLEIIEALIDAGAAVEPGTIEWWNAQTVSSENLKQRVLDALTATGAQ